MAGRSVRSSGAAGSRGGGKNVGGGAGGGTRRKASRGGAGEPRMTRGGRTISSGAGGSHDGAHGASDGGRRGRTISSHRDGTADTSQHGRVRRSAAGTASASASQRTGDVKRSVKPKASSASGRRRAAASPPTGEHRFPLETTSSRPRVASNAGARHDGARTVSSGKSASSSSKKNAVAMRPAAKTPGKTKSGGPSFVARMRDLLPKRGRQTNQVRRTRIIDEPISRSEPGSFVDANNMRSEDIVAKTLRQTAGTVGVATRPKVVDFTKRQKERRRANLRQTVTHVAAAVGAIAVVAAIVWLLFFSPVLRLNQDKISVSGANQWVSDQQIMAIARGQAGKSLLLVSDAAVEEQLSQIPGVSSAQATKRFPNGFDVHVEAQRPAAMLRVKGTDTLTAVDNKARVLNAVDAKSAKGIPVIDVTSVDDAVSSRALRSAVVILDAFPEGWRKDVTAVSAPTQDSITTTFANGITVVWGDDTDLKLKMAIADKVMNDPKVIGDKKQINVSAPNRPIIK